MGYDGRFGVERLLLEGKSAAIRLRELGLLTKTLRLGWTNLGALGYLGASLWEE